MLTPAMPAPRRAWRPHPGRLPSPRRTLLLLLALAVAASATTALSTAAYLRLPAPTGIHAVGRLTSLLTDESRQEPTDRGGGPRAVPLTVWYPAVASTGRSAPYVPDLPAIRKGLEASGELGPAVAGLHLVGTAAREDAEPATAGRPFPVLLLSPGNATNVAFYASLAEDLASRGFVVIGVDHPFQVTAVATGDGRVAVYREETMPGDGGISVARRIDERVQDLRFVIDRLVAGEAGLAAIADRIDPAALGVLGHSNGGVAAAVLCREDARVAACLNIDGQHLGGPFGTTADPQPPTQPFLYLTKELALPPAGRALFEAGGADTYRVVVPAAAHDSFGDGARLRPRPLPIDGTVEAVHAISRDVAARFFERYLGAGDRLSFDGLAPKTDLLIEVYPLETRSSTP